MATRFMVFREPVGMQDPLIQQANDAMAEVESKGGKYIDSHWSVASPAGPGGRDKGRIEAPGIQDPVPASAESS